MNKNIISLEGVSLNQEERLIFDNINLSIKEGDFVYLVGETGSGKSSLVKSLYAEIKVSAGNISVSDYNLNKIQHREIPSLRRKLGIVFQDFQLLQDRTVYENLAFVLNATGWNNKTEISNRISEVLESVHLEGFDQKMPYELSGGEQQRAAIARALLNKPEVILADEPTGNLDPRKSEKIVELLKEINDLGTTIVIATHDYEIIKKFNSRIIKCANKKIEEITIAEL
ncbi:MAG: ATP-binding cassette domain-containing protein [Flavobacteriales bacterium]|jgi:cell division transport system ATP-binding protein|nr:ATP-binding cassette domain-containing protein [Flavobacteriales bacterium]